MRISVHAIDWIPPFSADIEDRGDPPAATDLEQAITNADYLLIANMCAQRFRLPRDSVAARVVWVERVLYRSDSS